MANITAAEVKFKIGLVGESGVGKSCLLVRWTDNDFFTEEDRYTIGVDYKFKSVVVRDRNVKLQVHDTAGQERFRTVTASFYRGAHGILLVYDVSNEESFKGRVEEWLKEIRRYTPDNTPIVLVGNKSDLPRVVDASAVNAFAAKHNLQHFETSAKEGTNVNQAFMALAEKIVDNKYSGSSSSSSTTTGKENVNLQASGNVGKKKGGCIMI
eukprot:TRINITY_DN25649_c0_g1_i1.p1 TRINITY_DN25649_c0_g1~~TRINITY_DN25649_c0_g1_i1.p1  ORF type:complete len:211 (+),score=43.91 TRINITY_DN25649_c0_g1_i1:73-705(+)